MNYEINHDYVVDFIYFINSADALIPSSLSQENFINNPSSAAFSWKNVEGVEGYNRSLTGLTFDVSWDASNPTNSSKALSWFWAVKVEDG